MSCCISRVDGVDGNDTTLQQAYDFSAGADPSILVSAAFGRVEIQGDAGVTDIFALSDDGGVDLFTFENSGNFSVLAPSPSITFGDGTGAANVDYDKADAFTAFVSRFRVAGVTRWSMLFSSGENVLWQRHDAAGVLQDVPFSMFQVDGSITISNDLLIDGGGAGGTGELDMSSDDASLQVGNALGSPFIDINHLPAETGRIRFRQVNDIDTTGDKTLTHGTATDALIIQDFDGAVFNDLIALTTIVTINVAANFDAAVTMDTTLGVVGDATLESDLTLDAATGAGDLTMAGQLSVGGAVAAAGEAIRARGTDGTFLCYDNDTDFAIKEGIYGIRAFRTTQSPFFSIFMSAAGGGQHRNYRWRYGFGASCHHDPLQHYSCRQYFDRFSTVDDRI